MIIVHVVKRQDGVYRIVEIGDGKVSDLGGLSTERFAQLWAQYLSCPESCLK